MKPSLRGQSTLQATEYLPHDMVAESRERKCGVCNVNSRWAVRRAGKENPHRPNHTKTDEGVKIKCFCWLGLSCQACLGLVYELNSHAMASSLVIRARHT
jgi:hypothetical protein